MACGVRQSCCFKALPNTIIEFVSSNTAKGGSVRDSMIRKFAATLLQQDAATCADLEPSLSPRLYPGIIAKLRTRDVSDLNSESGSESGLMALGSPFRCYDSASEGDCATSVTSSTSNAELLRIAQRMKDWRLPQQTANSPAPSSLASSLMGSPRFAGCV